MRRAPSAGAPSWKDKVRSTRSTVSVTASETLGSRFPYKDMLDRDAMLGQEGHVPSTELIAGSEALKNVPPSMLGDE